MAGSHTGSTLTLDRQTGKVTGSVSLTSDGTTVCSWEAMPANAIVPMDGKDHVVATASGNNAINKPYNVSLSVKWTAGTTGKANSTATASAAGTYAGSPYTVPGFGITGLGEGKPGQLGAQH